MYFSGSIGRMIWSSPNVIEVSLHWCHLSSFLCNLQKRPSLPLSLSLSTHIFIFIFTYIYSPLQCRESSREKKMSTAKNQAELLRQDGNTYFKKDRFGAAIDAYTEVYF